jgi:hypothetical protein
MEKRIADLSSDPYTISLMDRKCSLFIDPRSGSIFVDEGEGEGRMNGVVFSVGNGPSFSVRPVAGADHQLILGYRGTEYIIGVSEHDNDLKRWTESANLLLTEKGKQVEAVDRRQSESLPRLKADEGLRQGAGAS